MDRVLKTPINILILKSQKQPPQVFYKEHCSWKFRYIGRKIPVLKSLLNKIAGLRLLNFLYSFIKKSNVDVTKESVFYNNVKDIPTISFTFNPPNMSFSSIKRSILKVMNSFILFHDLNRFLFFYLFIYLLFHWFIALFTVDMYMIKDNTFFRFFLSLYLPYFTKNLENYFETVQNNFSRFYFVKESRYMRQVSANEVNNLKYGLLWWPR